MPIRDILLAILLIFNAYFAYAIYDLNIEKKEATVIEEINPQAEKYSEVDYKDYASLYMFKQIIPSDVFTIVLLPSIEVALKDGSMNESEWTDIKLKMESIKESHKLNFSDLYLAKIQEEDLNTTVMKMFNEMGEDVNSFGSTLKEDFKGFIEKNKDIFKSDEEVTDVNTQTENSKNSTETAPDAQTATDTNDNAKANSNEPADGVAL